MTLAPPTVANAFLDAICALDLPRATALLHPEIDFRAMTPNRIWEAAGPADVEAALRQWLADPDEEIDAVEPVAAGVVQDTARVGWQVRLRDAEGAFVYEQQAYVRERAGQVGWLRIMCSGPRPL